MSIAHPPPPPAPHPARHTRLVQASDGAGSASIYAMPVFGFADGKRPVYRLELSTQTLTKIADLEGKGFWHDNFAVGPDGAIYGAPCTARHVLRLDTDTQEVDTEFGPVGDFGIASLTRIPDARP